MLEEEDEDGLPPPATAVRPDVEGARVGAAAGGGEGCDTQAPEAGTAIGAATGTATGTATGPATGTVTGADTGPATGTDSPGIMVGEPPCRSATLGALVTTKKLAVVGTRVGKGVGPVGSVPQ